MSHVAGAFVIRSVDQILPYCVIRDLIQQKILDLKFCLKNSMRFHFDSDTCLNYQLLHLSKAKIQVIIQSLNSS